MQGPEEAAAGAGDKSMEEKGLCGGNKRNKNRGKRLFYMKVGHESVTEMTHAVLIEMEILFRKYAVIEECEKI